jgi:hypothetical protein
MPSLVQGIQWWILPNLWQFYGSPHFKESTKSAGSRRRALLRWVQIALKPASKTPGFHGVFVRCKGLKYVIADSAFKRMQVDARACWLDTGEHHRGLALRTSGALNCNEWNDGRQALRLGHDASLKQAGAQHSLSPVMPRRRSGDCPSMRLQGSQKRVNSRILGRKVSASKPEAPLDAVSFLRQLPIWGLCVKELSLLGCKWRYSPRDRSTGFASKSFGHVASIRQDTSVTTAEPAIAVAGDPNQRSRRGSYV